RVEHLGRPQVGEQVHLLAQPQQATLWLLVELDVVPLRAADRAEQHGVGLERGLHRGVAERHAVFVEGGAAHHVFLDVETDRALLGHPGDDLAHFIHDFGADAVAWQHQQVAIGSHCLVRPRLRIEPHPEERAQHASRRVGTSTVPVAHPSRRIAFALLLRMRVVGYSAACSQGCDSFCFCSKSSISDFFSMVRPMSSRPSSRQRLRKGSMSKWTVPPSGPLISCFSRSISMMALEPRLASSISLSITSFGTLIGKMPFLKQLL